jgi:hypothetical protein
MDLRTIKPELSKLNALPKCDAIRLFYILGKPQITVKRARKIYTKTKKYFKYTEDIDEVIPDLPMSEMDILYKVLDYLSSQ